MSDGYIDLAYTPKEIKERETENSPLCEQKYPWGTSFSLSENVLDEMEHEDWKVDGIIHFHVMAKVTGINSNETQGGSTKCINFQMIAIKGESEDAEDDKESRHAYSEKDIDLTPYGYRQMK